MSNPKGERERMLFGLLTSGIKQFQLQDHYEIILEPLLNRYAAVAQLPQRRPDILILKGGFPFIIIEEAPKRHLHAQIKHFEKLATVELDITRADYFVVTDLEVIRIYERGGAQFGKEMPFEALFDILRQIRSEESIKTDCDRTLKTIQKLVMVAANENTVDSEFASAFFASRKDSLHFQIKYNPDGRFFHFYNDADLGLENLEHKFFQLLLPRLEMAQICRYTTLDSFFQTVKNGRFRMASNLAMNDRGEIDYVDKYIDVSYKPLETRSLDEMRQLNRSYISSCTTIAKADELTMYRFYGDDTRGVCLCFDLIQVTDFLCNKISYGNADGTHPQLDLIKRIIELLEKLGIPFRFLYLDLWKHFFKAYEYSVEEEIRLLYIHQDSYVNKDFCAVEEFGWVIARPDNIVSKYVLFKLNINNDRFPLKLRKVILGPNCPEASLNKKQIELLLSERDFDGVTVEHSKIQSYRKA